MGIDKKLLVLNTLFSYGRTLLGGVLTLFATRWVVNALGARDFGLYGLVGGMVSVLGFINLSLSGAAQRFFSYAMNQGVDEVRDWFKTSVCIHLALSLVFLMSAGILYPFAFESVFVIEHGRLMACKVVYWCAVASGFLSVLNVPFNALFIAKQRIFELTILNMAVSVASFFVAHSLLSARGDRLVIYAVALSSIQVASFAVQMIRSRFAFAECRWSTRPLQLCKVRQLLSFSVFTLLGTVAYLLRGQGLYVIFNRYGASSLNASYGVAGQVAGQTCTLAGALTNAMTPGIISQYGAGDREGACAWAIRVCKFATILSLIVFIPLFLEADYILKLWLISPPEGCLEFVLVMMAATLMPIVVVGAAILVRASGRMALYETFNAVSLLGVVVCAWIGCRFFGCTAKGAIIWILPSSALCTVISLEEAWRTTGFQIGLWIRQVLVKGMIVGAIGFGGGWFVHAFSSPSIARVVLVAVFSFILVMLASWRFVLLKHEREWLLKRIVIWRNENRALPRI